MTDRLFWGLMAAATVGFVLCIGCMMEDQHRANVARWTTIRTVDHKGHFFVVATYNEGVSMLHSPDCPCLPTEKLP
jgi:hypothetical protein